MSQDMPPKSCLEKVIDPLTAFYCYLWDRRDARNSIKISWQDMGSGFKKKSVRANLRHLEKRGLITYEESKEDITIYLVNWDVNE